MSETGHRTELTREVVRDRRRRAVRVVWVAVPLLAAAWLAREALVLATTRSPVTVVSVPAPPTVIVGPAPVVAPSIPQVIVLAPAERRPSVRPCPPPDPPRDEAVGATSAAGREGRIFEYETIVGVTASKTRHGLLAAWSEDTIYRSRDDGRTFERVLDAPGSVDGVVIDCHGRVIAVRDGRRLGVRDDADEGWRSLDFGSRPDGAWPNVELATGGGVLALMVPGDPWTLATTRDLGETWRFHSPGWIEQVASFTIDDEGVVRALLVWTDCMDEGARAGVVHADGRFETWELEYFWGGAITDTGWIYHLDSTDERLVARRVGKDVKLERPLAGDEPEGRIAYTLSHGDRAILIRGDRAFDLVDGRMKPLGRRLPEADWKGVDLEGRLLGIVEDALVRWSPRHGTRYLFGQRRGR